jgi:hypothetical protein
LPGDNSIAGRARWSGSIPVLRRRCARGWGETLTLQRLGATGGLYRSRRSTNAIENLNGSVVHFCHNVRRWNEGSILVRWIGSALNEAQQRFRRLNEFQEMKHLVAAVDR